MNLSKTKKDTFHKRSYMKKIDVTLEEVKRKKKRIQFFSQSKTITQFSENKNYNKDYYHFLINQALKNVEGKNNCCFKKEKGVAAEQVKKKKKKALKFFYDSHLSNGGGTCTEFRTTEQALLTNFISLFETAIKRVSFILFSENKKTKCTFFALQNSRDRFRFLMKLVHIKFHESRFTLRNYLKGFLLCLKFLYLSESGQILYRMPCTRTLFRWLKKLPEDIREKIRAKDRVKIKDFRFLRAGKDYVKSTLDWSKKVFWKKKKTKLESSELKFIREHLDLLEQTNRECAMFWVYERLKLFTQNR